MKKTALTLALLATVAGAHAQSSLTVYGTADLALTSSKSGDQRQTGVTSGTNYESKIGFRGTEDLGGGLKANFVMEGGFKMDTGEPGEPGMLFGREVWVGLSGAFGEIQAGRAVSAYDHINGAGFSAKNGNLSAANNVVISRRFSDYVNNGVTYITPTVGGLTGAVTYGFGENKNASQDAGSITSLSLKYAQGPLMLGLGYQTEKPTGNDSALKFTRGTATYDFGSAKLLAAYGRVAQDNHSNNEWHLGADVPVTPQLTLSGGVARSTGTISSTPGNGVYGRTAVVSATEQERTGYGLTAYYALSKRTTAYAGYQSYKVKTVSQPDTKGSLLAVGLLHLF
ncbi:porin [Macromonas nakdongensis]|uniref:porin n=1 Tax=Macromonas nakdongensis TaxID=1843082 RepID=UPI0012FEAB63|nr:porin [Macromonas nakdongensis]